MKIIFSDLLKIVGPFIFIQKWSKYFTTVLYKESYVFAYEDFPKENQNLANKATNIGQS